MTALHIVQAHAVPPVTLGIGIVTYNRRDRLLTTLAAVQRFTTTPARIVVADDGGTDGTVQAVRHDHPGVAVVTGRNRGVCWNKNRALWHLRDCDVVLLVEDDATPTEHGWELDWIEATQMHGHINLHGEWFKNGIVSGRGTPLDPYASQGASAQVSGFSRDAIDHVGYFDTRFIGFGMGHVEHTHRLIRAGYGGRVVTGQLGDFDAWQLGRESAFNVHRRAPPRVLTYLLTSKVLVTNDHSHRDVACEAANQARFAELVLDQVYRSPWSCDGELAAFRAEATAERLASQRQGDAPGPMVVARGAD